MATDWTDKVADILNISADEVSTLTKKRKISFGEFMAISQAVEEKDSDRIREILGSAVTEQDVPSYTGGGARSIGTSRLPTTPSISDTNQLGNDTTEVGMGDQVVVKTMSGDENMASVVRKRAADEYEVTSPDNPNDRFIVKQDQIVSRVNERKK